MNASELLSLLTQAIFVVAFVLVLLRAIGHRTPAHIDAAVFFGLLAAVIVESRVVQLLGVTAPEILTDVAIIAIVALPYLLLRLLDDFTYVPVLVKRLAEVGLFAIAVAVLALATTPVTGPLLIAIVAYFAVVSLYSGAMFLRGARRAQGVTRRRLEAISAAAIAIGLDLVVAGAAAFVPEPDHSILSGFSQVLGLAAALGFYVGFAPPTFLRRAWQAPELRSFLARAAQLPRLPTTQDIVRELERGAASSTGATARIGVWQPAEGFIRCWTPDGSSADVRPGEQLAGRVFELQRTIFSIDPARDNPAAASEYRRDCIGAMIAAPITAGEQRLGVLSLYAERPPIFALSDLELAQLIADQAAVILESRALIDHAARVQAQEAATRMKEDFLSAAAHDLKTPLTTVVAQAEFLERRASRDPSAPVDRSGLQRIVREAKRLSGLVTDLLDAARLEQGRLVGEREPVDLGHLVAETAARIDNLCEVDVRGAVVGTYDARRMEQLVQNLVENARKYSTSATPVHVSVWQQDGEGRISVRDEGIGIPAADLPRIFERFARASNVDDRRFHGMGLGLYICRGIVDEHGGRIWAESTVGKGTTFHVALPLSEGRRLN